MNKKFESSDWIHWFENSLKRIETITGNGLKKSPCEYPAQAMSVAVKVMFQKSAFNSNDAVFLADGVGSNY